MSAPIFPSHHAGRRATSTRAATALTSSGIWRIVTGIAARAGLPALRPHDLRRSFAQMCQDGGADLSTIKHALGHSSVQTTERYLSQIADLRKGKAAGDHIRMTKRQDKTKTTKETA